MSASDSSCYTVVFESTAEYPSAAELRSGLEKGSDEVKIDTLRKIIVSTINGNPQVRSLLNTGRIWVLMLCTANVDDAYNTICHAFTEQAPQEIVAFLLGGLSKV
jgi:hypothetical protein